MERIIGSEDWKTRVIVFLSDLTDLPVNSRSRA
jgi:hypothetical protein